MKINFTKKEYRLLLDMLYLSDWMINAHIADIEADGHPEYKLLRKKIMSHYKEMDTEGIINYDNMHNDYFETREYEESLHDQFIEPYENETFWDELVDRLAARDLEKEFGVEKLKKMDNKERFNRLQELSESYQDKFETHGLDHLQIL